MTPSLNLRPWTYLFSVILSFWVHFFMLTGIMSGISTDSKFSHFAWANQSRKEGGLGPNLKLPLIADRNMQISRDYGVLLEDEGIALRGLFIIDPQGILRYVKFCLYLETYQPSVLFQANHCQWFIRRALRWWDLAFDSGVSVHRTPILIGAVKILTNYFRMNMVKCALLTGPTAPRL